jgi:type III pantothenate kinase
MLLLFDIGNTHTHLALADRHRLRQHADIETASWFEGSAGRRVDAFTRGRRVTAAALCSVVPSATPFARRWARKRWSTPIFELTARTVRGVGIRYPKPETIGPDRLANALGVKEHFGAPAVVVDFGTAVTFDVVDRKGDYVGGIIAPGLAAMTDYLHEKTALLPRIRIREINAAVGKSTEQAMLIGAVRGYRGLIRELLGVLSKELKTRNLPVVATGSYARLMAARLPEISAVRPLLTLEGLRLAWLGRSS